jgi:phosphoglycolate phosphatase
MNKKNDKMIIFDMDGTLINSGKIIANTINYVRLESGLCKMDDDILLANINNPDINSAEFFYEVDAFSPKHSELFESYYDEHHLKDIVLYDGIEKLLEGLSKEYLLTIATNAHTNFAISMTKHLHIYKYFDYIIGADKVDKPKPNPQMVEKIIDNYDIELDNIVLVGDSHKDMLASQGANIGCVLVNWGFSSFDNTSELNHNCLIAENINELYKIFNL